MLPIFSYKWCEKNATHIFIENHLLKSPEFSFYLKNIANRFAIITDEIVENTFAKDLSDAWKKNNLDVSLFSFLPGESSKNRETKEILENALLKNGFGRDCAIIAIGGGVVTDLGGFIAATYCRGIPLVLIPTTLMGMVDAAIGGKTGVNTPYGKNLIGAFYCPTSILIDPTYLDFLPEKQIKNGLAEVIKYGLIASPQLFFLLEKNSGSLPFLEIIKTCIQIKNEIVTKDPLEKGSRRILNFGHTIAHSIEASMDYQILHGEAVACGMVVESYISYLLGHLPLQTMLRICKVISTVFNWKEIFEKVDKKKLFHFLKSDKKSENHNPRFVLLSDIGIPLAFEKQYCTFVHDDLIMQSLDEVFACPHI